MGEAFMVWFGSQTAACLIAWLVNKAKGVAS